MTLEEETFYILQEPVPVIDQNGTKIWYNKEGKIHRDNDLPAVIYTDGAVAYVENGQFIGWDKIIKKENVYEKICCIFKKT